jgi:hypothetical protein
MGGSDTNLIQEKKKKLSSLIQELYFPLDQKEADEIIRNFSDDSLDDLIAICETILDGEEALEDAARRADPAKYKKLVEDWADKIVRIGEFRDDPKKYRKLDAKFAQEEHRISNIVAKEESLAELLRKIREFVARHSDNRSS